MANLHDHALAELTAGGWMKPDSSYDGMIGKAVLELIDAFAKQGHSGGSASPVISLFSKVAAFEPLGPLTGNDDEWTEVGEGVFQNKRCSHVFKDSTGAYDSEGRIFREPNGCCFQSEKSRVFVTFPYTPETKYVRADTWWRHFVAGVQRYFGPRFGKVTTAHDGKDDR